jgi:hypothetical protein
MLKLEKRPIPALELLTANESPALGSPKQKGLLWYFKHKKSCFDLPDLSQNISLVRVYHFIKKFASQKAKKKNNPSTRRFDKLHHC